MQINERLVKYNFSSRNNNTIEYIVIHDTGNKSKGADANAHFNFFNTADRQSSAHYFVDDIQILRIIKDKDKSWHCGDGKGRYGIRNENSIGIEMCINIDSDFNTTINNTIELTAYLMNKYNIPIENIVRHYDASRKICPNIMSKNNWILWDEFKDNLYSFYNNMIKNDNNINTNISDNITNFIDNVYRAFLYREPDYEGKMFWYNKLKSKSATIENFVNSLMNSPEFIEIKNIYI